MGAPVASPSDLQTYLGVATIDTNRATLILAMAQDLCETIVSPLPATARAVVLDVAARAFVNPQQLRDAALGTGRLQYGTTANDASIGGLYLSRTNKATLKQLAGRGAAFSADTLPPGINAVQTVTVSASGGTYTLSFGGAVTAPIAFNATAAQVQAALEALTTIGTGNVSVAGSYAVTFIQGLRTRPVPPLIADGTALTGGGVVVAQTVIGVPAPGQDLPGWDFDYYSSTYLGHQIFGPY